MGTGEDSQNSILKGILQNGASFNYPGSFNYQTYTVNYQYSCCQLSAWLLSTISSFCQLSATVQSILSVHVCQFFRVIHSQLSIAVVKDSCLPISSLCLLLVKIDKLSELFIDNYQQLLCTISRSCQTIRLIHCQLQQLFSRSVSFVNYQLLLYQYLVVVNYRLLLYQYIQLLSAIYIIQPANCQFSLKSKSTSIICSTKFLLR